MAKRPIDYINIKEDMPTVSISIDRLKYKLSRCRLNKIRCLYIIHGYGSTGKGGAICTNVRKWLNAQLRNGKIKTVVFGEDFNIVNEAARNLYEKYAGLDELLRTCNNGVTVIEL
ncbi:MAG: Smr/MutS family protein [Clostridia bacterium]|nr:Smr/MutS family protein [Clostridia bacterium]